MKEAKKYFDTKAKEITYTKGKNWRGDSWRDRQRPTTCSERGGRDDVSNTGNLFLATKYGKKKERKKGKIWELTREASGFFRKNP